MRRPRYTRLTGVSAIVDDLGMNDPFRRTTEAFDDGAALWEAVCENELEGVVAKRPRVITCLASAAR
jgi:ATP-dependent DNA ligase